MEVPNRKPVASSAASSCADLGVMRSRSLSRKLNSLTDRCTFVQAHEAWQMIQMIYPSHKMPSVWLARAQFMCESQFLTRELCSMLHCDVFVWHSKVKELGFCLRYWWEGIDWRVRARGKYHGDQKYPKPDRTALLWTCHVQQC